MTNLGALDALSLSSLDGSDGSSAPAPSSFAPPAASAARAAPIASPMAPAPAHDPFAAPASADEFAVDLSFEVEPRPRPSVPMMANPVRVPGATSGPLPRPRLATPAGGTSRASATTLLRDPPRWRHAAGVLLAVMLGFAPAHLVAAMREDAKYAQIDKDVIARQTAAATPEAYAALDTFRAEQIDRKKSARRMIALLAIGIWIAAAGLIAFVWFRLIPWDRR